jgi:uncharacterized damage-inducible protein DinB
VKSQLAIFQLATAHTRAVIALVEEDDWWDHRLSESVRTLREQLVHISLIRESVIREVIGRETAGLKESFASKGWIEGGTCMLLLAYHTHSSRCWTDLQTLDCAHLDQLFKTPFGNISTPRNYLRLMLLEETHHRAQMIQSLRILGGKVPEFPGRDWAELGL